MERLRTPYACWERQEWKALFCAAPDSERRLCALIENEIRAPVFALNAARTGLWIALQLFKTRAPDRHEVLLPSYICPAVIETVKACGLRPVFAPVGADLNLDPMIANAMITDRSPPLLAVLVAHMYGCPAAIESIEAAARARGVEVIDDAAHAPLLNTEQGPLGRRGSLGLGSFAQSKMLVTGVRGSGGLLIVNDPSWLPWVEAAVKALRAPRHRPLALIHFGVSYLCDAPRLGYYLDRFSRAHAINWYAPARISRIEASIACAQFQKRARLIADRLRVLALYQEALAPLGLIAPQLAPGRYLSRLLIRSPDPALRHALAARRIFLRPGYSDHAGPLLELPLHVTLCAAKVKALCKSVADVLKPPQRCDILPC